jgi:hypothetical protein
MQLGAEPNLIRQRVDRALPGATQHITGIEPARPLFQKSKFVCGTQPKFNLYFVIYYSLFKGNRKIQRDAFFA